MYGSRILSIKNPVPFPKINIIYSMRHILGRKINSNYIRSKRTERIREYSIWVGLNLTGFIKNRKLIPNIDNRGHLININSKSEK